MSYAKQTILIFLSCIAVFLPRPSPAADVLIVSSSGLKPYQEAIDGLTQSFGRATYHGLKTVQGVDSEIIDQELLSESSLSNDIYENRQVKVVVAVGVGALNAIKEIELPVVYLLVPAPEAVTLGRKNFTGVSLDVDPVEQLRAITENLPGLRKIGLLYSRSANTAYFKALGRAATKFPAVSILDTFVAQPQSVYPLLQQLSKTVDAILLAPDPGVLTPDNLDLLALNSLESRTPLIAFAPQYLKHGAALAVFSSPEDMGRQAAKLVLKILSGEPVSGIPPEFSRTITVQSNRAILQKLGLENAASGNKTFRSEQ